MSNGRTVRSQAYFLAALILSIGGCSVEPGGLAPVARQQADAARQRAWSLDAEGLSFHDRSAPAKTVQIPLPGWVWVGPPRGCPPNLALGPRGEIVVTSDVLPTLWRVDPVTFEVSVHPLALDADTDKDAGFSGLVYSSRHGAYFAVSHALGSMWRIDPLLKTAHRISQSFDLERPCGPVGGRTTALISMRDL